MRTRSLVAVLLLLAAAAPAQAGWNSLFQPGWVAPQPVDLLRGGFHRSDSAGKQVARPQKEFKDPEWGRVAKQLFKHPDRPLPNHMTN